MEIRRVFVYANRKEFIIASSSKLSSVSVFLQNGNKSVTVEKEKTSVVQKNEIHTHTFCPTFNSSCGELLCNVKLFSPPPQLSKTCADGIKN